VARRRAAAALIALVGCAHAQRPPDGGDDPRLAAVLRLATEIEALRGIRFGHPPRVRFVDGAAMRALHPPPEPRPGLDETVVAFGLAPPSARASLASPVPPLGEYDARDDTLSLLADLRADGADRPVVAHELAHALDARRFGHPDLAAIADLDELLARRALLEGDAELVARLDEARARRAPDEQPLARALARAAWPLAATPAPPPALYADWLASSALFVFPYYDGMAFVGALERAGGFALVDRMLEHPPTSTSEILHPQRWLDGAGPEPVDAPAAPPGFRMVARGRFGERLTRDLLEACLGAEPALAAATGWSGDAYAVFAGEGRRLALAWSTAWETPADAVEFARAAAGLGRCWSEDARRATAADRFVVEDRLRVRRDGRRVVVVRGLPEPLAQSVDEPLAPLSPAPAPRTPPLGPLRLPPPPEEPPPPGRGRIAAGRYWIDERLGIAAELPPGFRATTALAVEFAMERHGRTAASATLRLLAEPAGDLAAHARAVAADEGRVPPATRAEPATFAGAPAAAVTIVDGGVVLRALAAPVCGGRATLALVERWAAGAGRAPLDGWERSLRPLSPAPPVCHELPKDRAPPPM